MSEEPGRTVQSDFLIIDSENVGNGSGYFWL
jgi:hypothetical protein